MRALRWTAIAALMAAAGCGSGGGAARRADPDEAAAGAIAKYDKDGNGELSAKEIDAAPELKSALARIDADKSGTLTRQELVQRFVTLKNGSSSVSVSVSVVGAKGPLVGADVTLTPEPYMGEGFPVFTGKTVEGGLCELKRGDKPTQSLPTGFYEAHVVHAASGVDKTLGCEVSDDISNRVRLKL